jgi:23S rRNA (cytidine1920-2'-O)/16S rRNA (cytidine1409-2'-O)-methyltransferase
MASMTRKRADVVLVERGFFASRARVQEAISAGLVSVNGAVVRNRRKPSSRPSSRTLTSPAAA